MSKEKLNRLFITATGEHVGKTTTTLGLISMLKNQNINVGYCKPVGQKFVMVGDEQVDKDAFLFGDFLGYGIEAKLHSPFTLAHGKTADYLDAPYLEEIKSKILAAQSALDEKHQTVVYEGTGHSGVGSVVDMSNADSAKLLGAKVVMVVEAGIGNAIDRLMLNVALFQQKGVKVSGVIINKAKPEKIDYIRKYLEIKLQKENLPLLGIIPYDEELVHPLMHTIKKSINGEVVCNENQMDNRVRDIIAGSLIDLKELEGKKDLLLVVSSSRLAESVEKLKKITHEHESPLSGIVITGREDFNGRELAYFKKHRIPVIRAQMDTYAVVVRISKIEVKINPRTPWKVNRAVNLFNRHIDLDKMKEIVGI